MTSLLMEIFDKLLKAFGPRHWWPGESPFEVMVGAILTQNTSWKNVEKAIQRLKARRVLTPDGIHRLKTSDLASLIRSSGFYRIKADRLKSFVDFLFEEFEGKIERMKKEPFEGLRKRLLEVKGIGQETADSILLYALQKPMFVVDAYTRRVLSRHGMISIRASYEEVQKLFTRHLSPDEKLFNEYHALLVHVAKSACKKIPKCDICPLKDVRRKKGRRKEQGARCKV
jgi:endonuclease-3 related protein